ncbi:Kynurenine 3-monooxygenase [Gracilariopsis chorda]|uniref:Kynurenine 3-monooxygenase n=1 Tax=Gracilariopsis chorda TaxID=448386 RepID=A0A2V3IM93_9FLOR|nr:Kynurenine 3-monooxygenase [Gracilariopsis chorda]|eukprot:PXF43205.1 Kynurenine 3-monooxygenase [Gracilariopsis chorda]
MRHSAEKVPHVTIVGAGPAGCLLALLLSALGCQVDLYDSRSDLRKSQGSKDRQRSINLALSTRGLTALKRAGVAEKIVQHAVPMHGRCIHPVGGRLQFHPYGQKHQHLLSVSRRTLCKILLDECEKRQLIQIHFGHMCTNVDLEDRRVCFLRTEVIDGEEADLYVTSDLIVGADGSFSRVRAAMARMDRFEYSQSYVPAAYKELTMVNAATSEQSVFPPEFLHIWPRHRFMLIALPNDEKSFTCTLFMDKSEMDKLSTPAAIKQFFKTNFPDAVDLLPSLVTDFINNPAPSLITVRCNPFNYIGNAVLVGDAAHAIVPFYGQGCNAAFEDCRLLAEAIEGHDWHDMSAVLSDYARARKPNVDTIADLAIEHYEDMSTKSARPLAVLRRRLEIVANRLFPRTFLPLYSMVSFSNIPYRQAVLRAKWQDRKIEQCVMFTGLLFLTASGVAICRAALSRPSQ